MTIHNLHEADRALNAFIPRPLKMTAVYNLKTVTALAALVGNPQEKLRVIHVAGTSGKTSTCYYTAALLRAAGLRVGLTVSPHALTITERVQIDGQPMDEAAFCQDLGEFLDIIVASDLKPSWFELMMVFAYWEFARAGVDYAVIETGLGGTWDGSNIVQRPDKICVITDIGIDHTSTLGTALSEIAYWKAGIIHPGNTVFMRQQDPAAVGVVRARSREQGADFRLLEDVAVPKEASQLPLFQQRNFTLARQAVSYALERDGLPSLTPAQLRTAAATYIPGRMESISIGGRIVILDGAHNAQKLATFARSLHSKFPGKSVAAVVSSTVNREHDLPEIAHELASLANSIIVTDFQASQDFIHTSISPEKIADELRRAGATDVTIIGDQSAALAALLKRPEEVLVITGSIYLLGQMRPLLSPHR